MLKILIEVWIKRIFSIYDPPLKKKLTHLWTKPLKIPVNLVAEHLHSTFDYVGHVDIGCFSALATIFWCILHLFRPTYGKVLRLRKLLKKNDKKTMLKTFIKYWSSQSIYLNSWDKKNFWKLHIQ